MTEQRSDVRDAGAALEQVRRVAMTEIYSGTASRLALTRQREAGLMHGAALAEPYGC